MDEYRYWQKPGQQNFKDSICSIVKKPDEGLMASCHFITSFKITLRISNTSAAPTIDVSLMILILLQN